MHNKFEIFNKVITNSSPTLIIAEIGINHLGNEKLCTDMILSAIDSGADCVKLQTGNIEESFYPDSMSYNTFKGSELSKDALYKLSKLATNHGSYLFSSPGDFSSLNILRSINTQAYKISSGQFTNIAIIQEIIKDNLPTIFSTGMAKKQDIDVVINLCKNNNFNNYAFLHCVSLYPTSYEQLNLEYIKYLKDNYNIISGYSDHTLGELACLAAVSMGAKIIEKHFTIDNNLKGADNSLSMNNKDFKIMCSKIREIDDMKYKSLSKPHPLELDLRKQRYRKLVAKKDIKMGEKLTVENIIFMRIEEEVNCIYASDWELVDGKISNKDIQKHSLITKGVFS